MKEENNSKNQYIINIVNKGSKKSFRDFLKENVNCEIYEVVATSENNKDKIGFCILADKRQKTQEGENMTKKEMFEMFNNLSDLLISNMNTFQNKMINMFEDFKTEIRQEISDFKDEIRKEMSEFKNEIRQEILDFKTEIRQELVEIKQRLTVLESFHEQDFARMNVQ